MEADLASIPSNGGDWEPCRKCVPDLPKADAASLSEMHTLQQIIDSLSGLKNSPAEIQPLNKQVQNNDKLSSSELSRGYVNLKSIPLPDRISIDLPAGGITILTDDGSDLTVEIVKNLTALDHQVVVLGLADTPVSRKAKLPEVFNSQINESNEEALLSAVQEFIPVWACATLSI